MDVKQMRAGHMIMEEQPLMAALDGGSNIRGLQARAGP